jgi:hypothetical protein
MADRLHIIAIRVNHKRAVVMRVVMRPQTRRTIVHTACFHGGLVESVDLRAAAGAPTQVAAGGDCAAVGGCALVDPSVDLNTPAGTWLWVAKAGHAHAIVFALVGQGVAQWRKRSGVKSLAAGKVADAKSHVVEHSGLCCFGLQTLEVTLTLTKV